MNNTGQIKSRMKSIRQTVQISNAQKLIAASRISKARHMLAESSPFHERIRLAIARMLALCPDVASRYLARPLATPQRRGMLVITSDRGLAGGYNVNIVKFAEQELAKQPADCLMVMGHVGRTHMANNGHDIWHESPYVPDPPTLFSARELAEQIIRLFDENRFDCFDVIYTQFTSTIRIKPVVARLFPLKPEVFGEPPKIIGSVDFEPSPEAVMDSLMTKYLKGFLYGCLVHAWASELASRITAMDSAIRNGNEMLESLALLFNRARQASITQEITEIVAGALSMKKKTTFLAPPKSARYH